MIRIMIRKFEEATFMPVGLERSQGQFLDSRQHRVTNLAVGSSEKCPGTSYIYTRLMCVGVYSYHKTTMQDSSTLRTTIFSGGLN